jgi:ubiquinone/menaquinone biosynthesis C-methylase UbiE
MSEKEFNSVDLDAGNSLPAASIGPWEAAYLRFETPEEEIQKFLSRLQKLGAKDWPRDAHVVELFCGRGNGLHALERLGFTHIEGLDLSPRLLAQYRGTGQCTAGDCRQLPFADQSKDVAIVQGGLHHLPVLPDDLERTAAEMHRVLKPSGRVMIVEPWRTPFLNLAHFISEIRLVRRLSNKMDAMAVMTEHEIVTYEQWLSHPDMILKILHTHFVPVHESFTWGKLRFAGKPV